MITRKMNTLNKLFSQFNKQKVNYLVRGRYKQLPNKLDGGDVDLLIKQEDWQKAEKIIRKLDFQFYPHTQPNLFYYYYDNQLGLVQLDIILSGNFPKTKRYKTFFIPNNNKTIPNKKPFHKKLRTGSRRRMHWLFRGPLIVFEGPDGSGKTTNAESLFKELEKLPLKKDFIHFATHFEGKKPSSLRRLLTRSYSLLRAIKNIMLGRLTITDRYVYLTFRKNPFLKKVLNLFTPNPDLVFLMKAPAKVLRKRKKGQRDQLSESLIKELYQVYDNIKDTELVNINTQKSQKSIDDLIINKVLKKILD